MIEVIVNFSVQCYKYTNFKRWRLLSYNETINNIFNMVDLLKESDKVPEIIMYGE